MSELKFDMLKWQCDVFADQARFKVVVAGRRCGKSRMAIITLIVKALECNSSDAGILYVAPTNGMARVIAWDLLLDLGRSVIISSNVNNSEVKLVNGVKIYIRGADSPDSLRGMKLYYAVVDEMKDQKDSVWETVVRPALSDMRGGALFIGTPEPGESLFRDYFERGQLGEDPEWSSYHFTTYDNELIAREEIEAAKRSISTFAFKQEYLASFDTAGADVFKEEWFLYGEEPKDGGYYITVDLAGFQDINAKGVTSQQKRSLDDTAICVVKVTDDGKWFVKKIDHGRWDVRENAVRILMAIRTYRPIAVGIEKGSLMRAVMPYLTDLMRKNNVFTHVEAISIGSESKANRVIYALQGMFEHGRITLNSRENFDKFKDQLLMFPSPKKHDDLPDALSLIQHLVTTVYGKPDDSKEYEVIDEVCGF